MSLALRTVPFSRYGSYLAFSQFDGGLSLRSVRGGAINCEAFGQIARVELLADGHPVPFRTCATPTCLTLESEMGRLEICLPEPNVIRLRGEGVGARLAWPRSGMFDYAFPTADNRWQVNCATLGTNLMLTPLRGQWSVDAPWQGTKAAHVVADLLPEGGVCEAAIEEFASSWHPRGYADDFTACRRAVEAEFGKWLEMTPALPPEYAAARELAAYINWSCVVAPVGHLRRPAMYMSKNWMTNVWSWDHCFNALALVRQNPDLAWDQLMVMFDLQDADGALPDCANDRAMIWNFCKPPVHGWTLRRMMEYTDRITTEHLREIYMPLARWTDWWLTFRDGDGDGVPQYNHGNDSGWDNATPFLAGPPLESADLCAFLVIQMDVLAEIAARLGKETEAHTWHERANGLLDRMLAHFWRGDRFVAVRSGDHATYEGGDSLFNFLPLVLGRRLPEDVRAALIRGLTRPGRFITAHGLATESPQSPLYEPDGYWRGPIWAPSTMLILHGLTGSGEDGLARELARKFCDMAARSGMAENYDALTGSGLRDRAYTWTASVFLVLGHEYLTR